MRLHSYAQATGHRPYYLQVDDRITLQMQELQQRQAAETEAMMKQMERMAKLTRETELVSGGA